MANPDLQRRFQAGMVGLVERSDRFVTSRPILVASVFSIVFLLVCALRSATKLLWFDEFATLYPGSMLPLKGTLAFFSDGFDVHPPLPSLLARAAVAVFGDRSALIRLPFSAAYLAMCLCIFRFVWKRRPGLYALAAMLFPAILPTFDWAVEIRGYSLVLALTGVALLCWQAVASRTRWRRLAVVGLFLSLAVGNACHYWAFLVAAPFLFAEASRTWDNRRFDWPVWLAIILSPSTLLLFVRSIGIARLYYQSSVWAPPGWSALEDVYRAMLSLSFAPVFGGVVLWLLLSGIAATPDLRPFRVPGPERVLIGSLALLPLIALPVGYMAGAYQTRYVMPCVAGIAIFLTFSLCRAFRGDLLVPAVLAAAFLGWFGLKNLTLIRMQSALNGGLRQSLEETYGRQPWVREIEKTSLPVVVTDPSFFLELQHYVPAPLRKRVYYVASKTLPRALGYRNYSADLNLLLFRTRLPLQVAEYGEFVAANPHFLLCISTSGSGGWHLDALRRDHARIRLNYMGERATVFDVSRPEASE